MSAAPTSGEEGCGSILLFFILLGFGVYFLILSLTFIGEDNQAQSACPGVGVSMREWTQPSFRHPLRMNVRVTCLDETVVRIGA